MGEWQPIETAPKDGTPVVVVDWGGIFPFYDVARFGFPGDAEPKCWISFYDNAPSCTPSHWLPLPPPPTPKD